MRQSTLRLDVVLGALLDCLRRSSQLPFLGIAKYMVDLHISPWADAYHVSSITLL